MLRSPSFSYLIVARYWFVFVPSEYKIFRYEKSYKNFTWALVLIITRYKTCCYSLISNTSHTKYPATNHVKDTFSTPTFFVTLLVTLFCYFTCTDKPVAPNYHQPLFSFQRTRTTLPDRHPTSLLVINIERQPQGNVGKSQPGVARA